MDDFETPFKSFHRDEQQGNVRIILDDDRTPDHRQPVTIRIIVKERVEAISDPSAPPAVRIIREHELAQLIETQNERDTGEEDSMTFGESVMLLIAIGVLMYLIYALLWPERF